MPTSSSPLQKQRFEALSDFRYTLRSFLRFSEDAAREEGITALQYQLLHTQGFPGRDWASIGELAERLRESISRQDFGIGRHKVTVSIGVSDFVRGLSSAQLMQQVHANLMEAKQQGRDRVIQRWLPQGSA